MRSKMLAHLESNKMIKFLPKCSLSFLGGEYNKGNESLGANEHNVASSPNLEDMC